MGFGPPHILGVYGFTLSKGVHWDLGSLTYMCHPFLLAEAEKEDAGGTQHQDAEHEAAPSRERGPHHRECCPREGEAGLGDWGTPHNGVPPASPHPTVLQEESCQAKRSPSSPQGGPKKRSAFGDLTNVSAALWGGGCAALLRAPRGSLPPFFFFPLCLPRSPTPKPGSQEPGGGGEEGWGEIRPPQGAEGPRCQEQRSQPEKVSTQVRWGWGGRPLRPWGGDFLG